MRMISENMAEILQTESIKTIGASPNYYIQNITPISLVNALAKETSYPKSILDLCASPGGKLLAAHDIFPKAHLFANDVSDEKIERLKANFGKYGVEASFSTTLGQHFVSNSTFDLVILDVPCSNSGVLNKRAEARWRIDREALESLLKVQKELLKAASLLTAHHGSIWYMTCSLLKEENEEIVLQFCRESHYKIVKMLSFLPNEEGFDGGFGAHLMKIDTLEQSSLLEAAINKQTLV
jgi:16S rRNA (cytosine967-C5)-methyltransferase